MGRELLSKYISVNPSGIWTRLFTWCVREAVGAVFVFSGFVKAIDPWGTLYKVNDYLGVLGLDIWLNLVLVGVFMLCGIEFLTGVLLCFGCFRRSAAWLSLAIMLFMLPLSLWIAMDNPVPDCGCFGDALIISNWATFWKNVALTAGTVWLSIFNRRISWLVTPALQWIAFVATAAFVTIVLLLGYEYQPLIDFRAYPVGELLVEEESDSDAEYTFIYEKDGVRKEFSETDELPSEDSGWNFVETVEKVPETQDNPGKKENPLKEKSLRLWDKSGENDMTEDALAPDMDRILILMPNLRGVSIAQTWKINSLYAWSHKNNIDMIAVVAGSPGDIALWEDRSMPEYQIYTADDTAIKSVARGNPAIVFTRKGIVEWKSTLASIDIDDFMAPGTSANPMSFAHDNRQMLMNLILIYVIVMAVLVALSFSTKLWRFLPKRVREKVENDDMAAAKESRKE